MNLEYTMDFKSDYKNTILKELAKNNINISDFEQTDLNKLSLKFHTHEKEKLNEENIDEHTSHDASYSSNMMLKWLNYIESEVRLSIKSVIEMAREQNVKIKKFPLHFELQLDIEAKSYQIVETNNNFNINI